MEKSDMFKSIGSVVTIVSVIIGVIISVMSFRAGKEKEAESRKIEAAKPFLELRQKLYLEALNSASILASKEMYSDSEVTKAKKRFSELYWGELSLVENKEIEKQMMKVANAEGFNDNPSETQVLTYRLAHLMRESLIDSWGIDTTKVGKVNP